MRQKKQAKVRSAGGRRSQQPNEKRALGRYRAKRDFSATPEPTGQSRRMPRKTTPKALSFCVQKHLATRLHYDFRLEHAGVLLSWAVPKGPSLNPGDKRLAMRVEDHPYDYKNFEGVIPSGYGAGVVMLWDEGTWQPDPGYENIAAALAKGELKFHLDGVKLRGGWALVRIGGRSAARAGGERESWLLLKHRDEHAGDLDIATAAPHSVRTDRSFEDILRGNPDVWDSHDPGDRDELEKIASKVAALDEKQLTSPSKQPRPRSRKTK